MARIRSIHPGQWTDEDFIELSFQARILTIAIRNEADDHGVFEWRPKRIKMRIFPADSVDCEALLDEMLRLKMVMRYSVNGEMYGAIKNFMKFQSPRKPTFTAPVTDEVLFFVGCDSEKTELDEVEENTVPQKSVPRQLEENTVPQKSVLRQLEENAIPQKSVPRQLEENTVPQKSVLRQLEENAIPQKSVPVPQKSELARQKGIGIGIGEKPPNPPVTGGPRSGYPADFEKAWSEYPQRDGGSSKSGASKAWSARIKAGAKPEDILAGVIAYRQHLERTGKIGTEYVKQAQTFFGPSDPPHWTQYGTPGSQQESPDKDRCTHPMPDGTRCGKRAARGNDDGSWVGCREHLDADPKGARDQVWSCEAEEKKAKHFEWLRAQGFDV